MGFRLSFPSSVGFHLSFSLIVFHISFSISISIYRSLYMVLNLQFFVSHLSFSILLFCIYRFPSTVLGLRAFVSIYRSSCIALGLRSLVSRPPSLVFIYRFPFRVPGNWFFSLLALDYCLEFVFCSWLS